MDNKGIIRYFRKAIALQELHEVNPFKVRAWQNGIFALEQVQDIVAKIPMTELEAALGKSSAGKVQQLIETGSVPEIVELEAITPAGVLDMMGVKGLGPKKLLALWKEHGIDSVPKLQAAAEANELAKLKGFGEKTQTSILKALQFTKSNVGKLHFADAEPIALLLQQAISEALGTEILISGQVRQTADTVDRLDFVAAIDDNYAAVHQKLSAMEGLLAKPELAGPFTWQGILVDAELPITVHLSDQPVNTTLLTSAATTHLAHQKAGKPSLRNLALGTNLATEEEAYQLAGLPYIIPSMRENVAEWAFAERHTADDLVKLEDLKGVLHNHSTYSDGAHTLAEMSHACRDLGFQYLGMADHSQSAFYANGLKPDRVKAQQKEIDQLNADLTPFVVLKGIESDILNDGSLDYEPEVLASFDYVVASVHSNLGMDITKATDRLVKAISNPYTTILGHPSGRLLLRRAGYPYDVPTIIAACKEYNVVIELNADPWRLDIDWRWIWPAQEAGLMVSVNPDAHHINSYQNMRYGVLSGRKGGLLKSHTFNAMGLDEMQVWLKNKRSGKTQ